VAGPNVVHASVNWEYAAKRTAACGSACPGFLAITFGPTGRQRVGGPGQATQGRHIDAAPPPERVWASLTEAGELIRCDPYKPDRHLGTVRGAPTGTLHATATDARDGMEVLEARSRACSSKPGDRTSWAGKALRLPQACASTCVTGSPTAPQAGISASGRSLAPWSAKKCSRWWASAPRHGVPAMEWKRDQRDLHGKSCIGLLVTFWRTATRPPPSRQLRFQVDPP
jgi:hypothetical protein